MRTVTLTREQASLRAVLPMAEALGLTTVVGGDEATLTGTASQLRAYTRVLRELAVEMVRPISRDYVRVANAVSKQNPICDSQNHATEAEFLACTICQEEENL